MPSHNSAASDLIGRCRRTRARRPAGPLCPHPSAASSACSTDGRPGWGANNTEATIGVDAGRAYIACAFTRVIDPDTGKTVLRYRVAAFNAATGEPITSFQPVADGAELLRIGGCFRRVNGGRQARHT